MERLVARVPAASTGNGIFVFPDRPKDSGPVAVQTAVGHMQMVEHARAAFRGMGLRIVACTLFAASLLSLFGFLSSTTTDLKFLEAVSATVCLIAAWHYKEMAAIRTCCVGTRRAKSDPNDQVDVSAVCEYNVDALRYGDWTVTLPLLVVELYAIIGRSYNGDFGGEGKSYDGLWLTPVGGATLAALMILLGAFVRLGLDDLSDLRGTNVDGGGECGLLVLGLIPLFGSIVILGILIADLHHAAEGIPDSTLLFSFFWMWIGYPIVYLVSLGWRVCGCNHSSDLSDKEEYRALHVPEGLSVFKDIGYGLLDIWCKAFLSFWVFHSAFASVLPAPFLGAPNAMINTWD
jgi:hypothetical protein